MEESVEFEMGMTDNQYYGILRMIWTIAYDCDPNGKVLRRLEALLRKQDVEELRQMAADDEKMNA